MKLKVTNNLLDSYKKEAFKIGLKFLKTVENCFNNLIIIVAESSYGFEGLVSNLIKIVIQSNTTPTTETLNFHETVSFSVHYY